jgi:hypothetical protein
MGTGIIIESGIKHLNVLLFQSFLKEKNCKGWKMRGKRKEKK